MNYVLTFIFVLLALTLNSICTQATVPVQEKSLPGLSSGLKELEVFYHTFNTTTSKPGPEIIIMHPITDIKIIKSREIKDEICKLVLKTEYKKNHPKIPHIHLMTCDNINCAQTDSQIFFFEEEIDGVNDMQVFNNRDMVLDFECWTGSMKTKKMTIQQKFYFRAIVPESVQLYDREQMHFYLDNIPIKDPINVPASYMAFKLSNAGLPLKQQLFASQLALHPITNAWGLFRFYYNRSSKQYFVDYDDLIYHPIFHSLTIYTETPLKINPSFHEQSYEWVLKKQSADVEVTLNNEVEVTLKNWQEEGCGCTVFLKPEEESKTFALNSPYDLIYSSKLHKLKPGKRELLNVEPHTLKQLNELEPGTSKTMVLFILCGYIDDVYFMNMNTVVRKVKFVVPELIPPPAIEPQPSPISTKNTTEPVTPVANEDQAVPNKQFVEAVTSTTVSSTPVQVKVDVVNEEIVSENNPTIDPTHYQELPA